MSVDLLNYVRDIRARGEGTRISGIKQGREWFWPKNANRHKAIAYALEYEPFTLLLKTRRFIQNTRRFAPLVKPNRPTGIFLAPADFHVERDPQSSHSVKITIPFYTGKRDPARLPTPAPVPLRIPSGNRKLIIIHAFYENEAKHIFDKLAAFNDYDVVLTTPVAAIRDEFLSRFGPKRAVSFLVPNLGRDVFSFLLVAAFLELSGYDHFIKVHTKRSAHLAHGGDWFWVNIEILLGNKSITDQLLERIDIARPSIYGVECSTLQDHFRTNRHWLKLLLNGQARQTQGQFVPGTMFAGSALFFRELATLRLHLHQFEPETGQLDGCLVHALERYFGYFSQARGGQCATIESLFEPTGLLPAAQNP